MAVVTDPVKIQHLYWRARLGITPDDLHRDTHKHLNKLISRTLRGGENSPARIQVPEADMLAGILPLQWRTMSKADRIKIFKKSELGIRHLNLAWLQEMATTDHPLLEKMSLFWHGHFACREGNVIHNQILLQVIRENALGNFGDLLFGVSKSAAMLQFLNNQQNRKQHPNENFAREVMELFTMGLGNYTEEDVREGARAFTGWGFDYTGQFIFRPGLHDNGVKVFLGKKGNFNGDDALNIILENKATSYHITRKIYRFFVNDTPDDHIVKLLADKFYQSHYDIRSLMEEIFRADWFYEDKNVGTIIKSPVELMAGMLRTVPADFKREEALLLFQRILGQVLFYPPNVGGWPGGRNWIDSSSLMFRMRLPQIIYYSREFNVRPKDMPDEMTDDQMTMQANDNLMKKLAQKVNAETNWDGYIRAFSGQGRPELPGLIADTLIVNSPENVNKHILDHFSDQSTRENYIKTLSINLMSTPEYQLC